MLQAQKLSKTVAGKSILKSVSFVVPSGSIVCVIGPSGAGKTSLLRALSLTDDVDSGEVTIDGRAIQYPELTVVFQQLFLWPHLTLRQNIELGSRMSAAELQQLLATFAMEEFVGRYPNETSLGQRQRAALARAIALKPKYLLLDEVTSALDIEQIEAVAALLEKLRKEGVGILAVTHHINFAKRISDQVIFMDKGRIVERGQKELLAIPKEARTKEFLKYF